MAVSLGTIACEQDQQGPAGQCSEVRDSAGIQVVENSRPPDGARLAWQIGPEPSVSIGVLEGEDPYMLFHATDATRLSDGRIVVVNRGTAELRVFDEFGTYLATWGGKGEGDGGLQSSLGSHPAQVVQIIGNLLHHETFGRTLAREPWGDLAIISPSDQYEFKAYARDGTLARIVRREHARRAPTDADLDAYVEGRVADMPSYMLEAVEERRRVFPASPVAAYFPAFESIMADRADYLWVEEYESPTDDRPARLWTVFDPEGRVLGHVETPQELEIYEIGEDYILGHTRDELDVEYVQVWPLDRSGG